MATDLAMMEELCPLDAPKVGVGAEDILVFPMAKSAVVQMLPGSSELTLFHGASEISFETPGQIAFARALARHERFRAGEALGWTGLAWDEIAEMLAALLDAGVLVRAEAFAGEPRIEREEHDSPLPPAMAETPHSWRDAGLIAALTGRDLEPGYLEAVVPIFRMIHPCLDSDGRQVGEANVFPKPLRLDVDTRWRTCTYGGTRYQPHRPMNVTALKAMRAHWREMMLVVHAVRAAYLRRFPDAGLGWTVGHVERLATCVLALPSRLMLSEPPLVTNGALHPVLSNLFRVTDGLRMAVHQMMFVPAAEAMLEPEAPTSAAEIYAYAERNYSFHSEHGVCAGPQFMIEEFLAVLLDGAAPKGGWPVETDTEVERALAEIEAAIDYGLLGLQTHGAAFSLWPAMARAYDEIGIALSRGEIAQSAAGLAFAAHRARLADHTYLGREPWRRHREACYAEMHASAGAGLGRTWAGEDFTDTVEAGPVGGPAAAAIAGALAAPAGAAVTESVLRFLSRGQAILRAVETSQSAINALLGRAPPQRRLTLRDLDIHNKLIGQPRNLPFLLEEIERHFGIAIDADAERVTVEATSPHPFGGVRPLESARRQRASIQGE